MPTPNFGLPLYGPTDTAKLDTLLNGQSTALDAALVQAQTDWFSKIAFAMAAGTVTLNMSFSTVNLPSGRFTQPPLVVAQLVSGSGGAVGITTMVTSITTTSFLARIAPGPSSTTTAAPVNWIAIQMTADNSAG